jgi:hypothetical protein
MIFCFHVINNKVSEYSRLDGIVVSACHWIQGSRVQTQPRRWIFKDGKNPQHTFLRMGSKAGGTMS